MPFFFFSSELLLKIALSQYTVLYVQKLYIQIARDVLNLRCLCNSFGTALCSIFFVIYPKCGLV